MTGLIYVVIIAVWAVVLVPSWLRRHDHQDPERSVDRFSRAMATLASRPAIANVLASRGQSEPAAYEPEVRVVTRPSARGTQAPVRNGATVAAARRRAVLGVLAMTLLAVLVMVALGVLVPAAIIVPLAAIGGFLGLARQSVKSRRGTRSSSTGSAAQETMQTPAPAGRTRTRPGIHADGTWDATSAPLPMYVTAPPASAVPRVIDTETPGAWTAAAMLERVAADKIRMEAMESAKREAIARAKAEQAAAEARTRDEDFLAGQAAANWNARSQSRRRAVNE